VGGHMHEDGPIDQSADKDQKSNNVQSERHLIPPTNEVLMPTLHPSKPSSNGLFNNAHVHL
jgi:hypothetical protein